MNKPIKKSRVFWLIQTLVWAGFTVFNLTARGYFVHYHIGELVNSFSLFVGLMVSTGCLRYFYQQTPNATLSAILWRIILGSILAGVTTIFIVMIIILPFSKQLFDAPLEQLLIQSLASLPVITFLILAWSSVYWLIKRQRALNQAKLRNQTLKSSLDSSQMEVLLNQLNPHFIFNAINNIRALILEDPSKARDALADLSDVMRCTMQVKQDKCWSLTQELALLNSYIAINRLHYEDRLDYEVACDLPSDTQQVPCMLLQLLVENALKHGISQQPHGGKIAIHCELDADVLTLSVKNTGKLKHTDNPDGIGIGNIKNRLQLLYGNSATLILTQEADWVHAKVTIPQSIG